MNWLEGLISAYAQQRATIPAADLATVAADAPLYMTDGSTITAEQVQAVDRAVIDYILHRIHHQIAPKQP